MHSKHDLMVRVSDRIAGSLQIRHSQESDEGKYECVAENSAGVAYSYAANLYVRGQCSYPVNPFTADAVKALHFAILV